jgi:adenosylcobyric acid synthase
VGTFHLLDEAESPLVRSFLINRFRGDRTLFQDGVRILEEKTQRPCLGVFPFAGGIHLDPEDSVSLERPLQTVGAAADQFPVESRVAIICLPHISNFTDFRLLPHAVYLSRPAERQFDFIFLPGTKSTIEDMLWLRKTGLERWLLEQVQRGARVIGVCGGFQMLGEEIVDPYEVESPVRAVRGIGLLPARTQLGRGKITRTVSARTPSGIRFEAYEIHMGVTVIDDTSQPFAILQDGIEDGVRLPRVIGTYLHGALENKALLEEILCHSLPEATVTGKDAAYDRLADWFAEHVNHGVLAKNYLQMTTTSTQRAPY